MADLNELEPDALLELMQNPAKLEAFNKPPEPPPPEAAVAASAPAPEPEKAPAEPAAAAEPEPEPDYDREILKSELAQSEANRKHFEQLVGRESGELDFLRKRLAALEGRAMQQPEPSEQADPYAEDPAPRPEPNAPQGPDGFRQWAVQKATEDSLNGFRSAHPDFDELRPAIMAQIQQAAPNAANLYDSASPIEASQRAMRFVEEAYYRALSEKHAQQRANLETKRAESITRRKNAAQASAISASGSASAPPAQAKPYADWSANDLEAELKRLTR